MAILPQTTGITHLALRVSDLLRAKRFYIETLGFSVVMDTETAFVFLAGKTVIGILAPDKDTSTDKTFASSRVGLDHLALSCESITELQRVADALTASNVVNTGIKTDAMTGKNYVAFTDPDSIWWEFYHS